MGLFSLCLHLLLQKLHCDLQLVSTDTTSWWTLKSISLSVQKYAFSHFFFRRRRKLLKLRSFLFIDAWMWQGPIRERPRKAPRAAWCGGSTDKRAARRALFNCRSATIPKEQFEWPANWSPGPLFPAQIGVITACSFKKLRVSAPNNLVSRQPADFAVSEEADN